MIFYLLLTLLAAQSLRLLIRGQLVTDLGVNLSNASYDSGSESAPFIATFPDPLAALGGIEDGAGNDVTNQIVDVGSNSDGRWVEFANGVVFMNVTLNDVGGSWTSSGTSDGDVWASSPAPDQPFPRTVSTLYYGGAERSAPSPPGIVWAGCRLDDGEQEWEDARFYTDRDRGTDAYDIKLFAVGKL